MLPDPRIVIAAVLSTFVLTVGVGFYASSRFMQEPKRTDTLAAFEETPVNRIALSWPEPTRQPDQLALDFAVTAKALRNPVRDVTSEVRKPVQEAAAEPQKPESANHPRLAPQREAAARIEGPAPVSATADVAPLVAAPAAPVPAPEPDIRIAVQYPPILELPAELQAPPSPASPPAPAAANEQKQQDAPVVTGSVADAPAADKADPRPDAPQHSEPEATQPEPQRAEPEPAAPQMASRPDAAEESVIRNVTLPELPKPAPKAARKKPAAKKAAPAKAKRPARPARRTIRRAPAPATTTFPFFWGSNVRTIVR